VLVTRPEPDAARTAAALVARGHQPVVAPVMAIVTAPAIPLDLHGVQAVAVTSGHAIRALAQIDDGTSLIRLPVFAVGDQTAALATKAGFSAVYSAAADGATLVELIAATLPPSGGPVLWPTGRDRAVDLTALLGVRGFQVRPVEVYRAEAVEALPAGVVTALRRREIDQVLVFSPRSASVFADLVARAGLQAEIADLPVAALSEAVAAPLRAAGHRRVIVAAAPTADALYQCLSPAAAA
jgi:uroporphyrinogen-III synthase